MGFGCRKWIIVVAVTLGACQGVACSEESGLQTGGVRCQTLGEAFSAGGVPGPEGWDKGQVNCCPGLVDRGRKEDYDDQCENGIVGGYYGRCLACGDGRCDDRFESRCNCPEDCKAS